MFSKIAFPAKMTGNDVTTRIAQNGEFGIDVVAEAIQADGFTTWDAAFAAFDANNYVISPLFDHGPVPRSPGVQAMREHPAHWPDALAWLAKTGQNHRFAQ